MTFKPVSIELSYKAIEGGQVDVQERVHAPTGSCSAASSRC